MYSNVLRDPPNACPPNKSSGRGKGGDLMPAWPVDDGTWGSGWAFTGHAFFSTHDAKNQLDETQSVAVGRGEWRDLRHDGPKKE